MQIWNRKVSQGSQNQKPPKWWYFRCYHVFAFSITIYKCDLCSLRVYFPSSLIRESLGLRSRNPIKSQAKFNVSGQVMPRYIVEAVLYRHYIGRYAKNSMVRNSCVNANTSFSPFTSYLWNIFSWKYRIAAERRASYICEDSFLLSKIFLSCWHVDNPNHLHVHRPRSFRYIVIVNAVSPGVSFFDISAHYVFERNS